MKKLFRIKIDSPAKSPMLAPAIFTLSASLRSRRP
jgi:hypothetical protein